MDIDIDVCIYPLRSPGSNNTTVGINIISTNVLVSEHHSQIKIQTIDSRADQEKYQMRIKHLVLPESTQVLKTNHWNM